MFTGSMKKSSVAERCHKWPGSIDAACKRQFRFTQDLESGVDAFSPKDQVESFHQATIVLSLRGAIGKQTTVR